MPKQNLRITLYWRLLLSVASGFLMTSLITRCAADTPEQEQYKLYNTLLTKPLGKDINPCKYPLHLVLMLDTAEGMRGTAQKDVQWALSKIGTDFLTTKDRLTLYNFDTEVHLEPGEIKTFGDADKFGGLLSTLLSKSKKPALDIYYQARRDLIRQANLFKESDKSHLIVAILITHKIYGKNGFTRQEIDSRFERLYQQELTKFLKGSGEMQRAEVVRKGENQPEIQTDILWAVEGDAKHKQSGAVARYKALIVTASLPTTTKRASPKVALYALMLLCGGLLSGCYWYVRNQLQSPITIKTSLGRTVERTITWEQREIHIYACETSASPKNPNDIYLPVYIKEQGDALTPKHLLTLSLTRGVTGEWRLKKVSSEVSLVNEAKHTDYMVTDIPYRKQTRFNLELRNGMEVEMDFTPGREVSTTLFNVGLTALISILLLLVFITLSQQSAELSESIPLPTKESVCQ